MWLIVFAAGLLIDLWLSRRLGQTSLILLLAAAALIRLKDFLPKRIDRNIKISDTVSL